MFLFINEIGYKELFFTVHLNQRYSGYTFWQSNCCNYPLVTALFCWLLFWNSKNGPDFNDPLNSRVCHDQLDGKNEKQDFL